ncbi:hypothetical protein ASPZODRAFT_86281 [Penicilliopsis zonata CBS 506.65]|uniref:Endoplasmic reticulum junction formation protein lunapark n=1 Tax=Penicilliopsis zonata CBS 506.65 TaxID=1073090 RepID=A0A1L9SU50_9EURO|nr:hypothetical protein ASPZODRAFT_86281 [Penicilliopsis zonata CBS 506.65]OJJ50719.1 hypothetical protein ASPZODRAFT_86281 [Penicilliopsis zonata CBS 506.65]
MVSLWPWRGQDNSPASFEKTLSALSTKITHTLARQDTLRQQSRRFKALWTLYTSFAYLLYSIILGLVLGWQNWGILEYAAVIGGPLLIYTVRITGSKYFEYRISKTQRSLDDLQTQRDATIEKLKIATKYNSTQQLLEKYGGAESSPKGDSEKRREAKSQQKGQKQPQPQQQQIARTGLPPPPTANIRQNHSPGGLRSPGSPAAKSPSQVPTDHYVDEPGFAPNAFSTSSIPAATPTTPPQYIEHPNHWYDRLLDVLLGEDETQPKNRIVLICTSCRLVNGQAPPGVKDLAELGRWRCASCGAWNGEEKVWPADLSASGALSAGALSSADEGTPSSSSSEEEEVIASPSESSEVVVSEKEEKEEEEKEEKAAPRRSKRGKARQR